MMISINKILFFVLFLNSVHGFSTISSRYSRIIKTTQLLSTKNEKESITNGIIEEDDEVISEEEQKQIEFDELYMNRAIELANLVGGERGKESPFPNAIGGAVLVTNDGNVLGEGVSDYKMDCIRSVIIDAGIDATPLKEWCINIPNESLRNDISQSTLYLTMEPIYTTISTNTPSGQESLPPITSLVELVGIRRIVIGCSHPVPNYSTNAASAWHKANIQVIVGKICKEQCEQLVPIYTQLANSKLHRMARNHYRQFKRPTGFLHCSVIDSNDFEAFARRGNAFGSKSGVGGRDFGSYEIAPPPELIWGFDAKYNKQNNNQQQQEDIMNDIFADEEDDGSGEDIIVQNNNDEKIGEQQQIGTGRTNPMMPWYEQVDAVVATFPRPENVPVEDSSITARLNGLKWLAAHGDDLPAGVERILVMDATDLADLPISNDDPNLPHGVNVEEFWEAKGRKPTRVLLRRGDSVQAKATASAVAEAAESAAKAAQAAMEAIETGDALLAAEAAMKCQRIATESTDQIRQQLEDYQGYKRKLMEMGVLVETLPASGEPIHVMDHLGQRNGYHSVVWRAGCWGERGVNAIMDGAFQHVSAHLAVDAKGGKFWQLMLAENAVQAACGPLRKVKIYADDEDLSLDYCDDGNFDDENDCVVAVDGRTIRHIRLDCRVALVNDDRPRELLPAKTKSLDKQFITEEAPWFL